MKPLADYTLGVRPTIRATFVDDAGTLDDPDAVTFIVRTPTGVETAYVYGVDSEVTRTSVGVFELLMTQLDDAGTWIVRANGVGTVTTSSERTIVVAVSELAEPLP